VNVTRKKWFAAIAERDGDAHERRATADHGAIAADDAQLDTGPAISTAICHLAFSSGVAARRSIVCTEEEQR
jgi:hypothetical protein